MKHYRERKHAGQCTLINKLIKYGNFKRQFKSEFTNKYNKRITSTRPDRQRSSMLVSWCNCSPQNKDSHCGNLQHLFFVHLCSLFLAKDNLTSLFTEMKNNWAVRWNLFFHLIINKSFVSSGFFFFFFFFLWKEKEILAVFYCLSRNIITPVTNFRNDCHSLYLSM